MSSNQNDPTSFVNNKIRQANDAVDVVKAIADVAKKVDAYNRKYGTPEQGAVGMGATKWVAGAVAEKAIKTVGTQSIAGMTGNEIVQKVKTGQAKEVLQNLSNDPKYSPYAQRIQQILKSFDSNGTSTKEY